jgi:hypothetical protein
VGKPKEEDEEMAYLLREYGGRRKEKQQEKEEEENIASKASKYLSERKKEMMAEKGHNVVGGSPKLMEAGPSWRRDATGGLATTTTTAIDEGGTKKDSRDEFRQVSLRINKTIGYRQLSTSIILSVISGEGSNQFRKAICHLKALNAL